MQKIMLLGLSLASLGAVVYAEPNANLLIDAKMRAEINGIIDNDIVRESLKNQNKRHKGLSQEAVDALDTLWREQRKSKDQYLIAATLSNPLSSYLTRMQAHSGGRFLEIFIMDNKGLNVGQSAVSSDYWQGDEGKWQKTYLKGAGTVFIDEPEYHEDRKVWAVQYNATVADTDGTPLGAVTFEVNLTELARLKGEDL